MRIQYILPALAGLLAGTAAVADTAPAGDAAKDQPPPWYQVEVVVFAHSDASDTEIWRDDPGTPDTAHAVSLNPSLWSPGLAADIATLSGPDDKGQALAAFLDNGGGADASGTTTGGDGAPVPFRLLPRSAEQLQTAVTRLEHADGYRVLYHAAWRQPAYSPDKAVPVHIDDDPYGTQAAMLRALDQSAGQSSDQPAGDADTSTGSDGGADQAPGPLPVIWGLNGVVEVTQSRYLHLRVDLVYQVQTPSDDGGAAGRPDGTVDQDTQVVHTYRMEQSRRILNDDLYYFDHPEFGVLAKVIPYQLPEPAPAPKEQKAQPDQTTNQPAPDEP